MPRIRFDLSAAFPSSQTQEDEASSSRLPVSPPNTTEIKATTTKDEPSAAQNTSPTPPCTFSTTTQPESSPHPLQQLRLRPASWSEDEFEEFSDDEWLGRASPAAQIAKARERGASPALSASKPSTPLKRPAGSITGIFSREVHMWASSSMFPPAVHAYAVSPSSVAKGGPAHSHSHSHSPEAPENDENWPPEMHFSESDVAEWDSAPGGSSVHSVPPSEDEESGGDEPMDVDDDNGLVTVTTSPSTPPRHTPQIRHVSTPLRKVQAPDPVDPANEAQEDAGDAQEVADLLTANDEFAPTTLQVTPPINVSAEPTTTPEPTHAEAVQPAPGAGDGLEYDEKPPAPPRTPPRRISRSGRRVPLSVRRRGPSPIVQSTVQAPDTPASAASAESLAEKSYEAPPVMMFGRRSSPSRPMPLERFTRGQKGKIACTWTPPPGHRPCMRSFTRRADLERHISTVHQMLNVACAKCGATFSRQDALTRHQRDSCAALFVHSH